MDIVEYTEKIVGVPLLPYQKEILREADRRRKEGRLVLLPVLKDHGKSVFHVMLLRAALGLDDSRK